MKIRTLVWGCLAVLWASCEASDAREVAHGTGDGSETEATDTQASDSSDDDSGFGSESGSQAEDGCPDEAKNIYVVTTDSKLYTFNPSSKAFVEIGKLDCPVYNTPLSMAVTRDAVAYVLFDGGKLFQVNTTTAACEGQMANLWTGNQETRGMGFATVGSSSQEVLYTYRMKPAPTQLASIDTSAWTTEAIGPMTGRPELTGTGSGELWGFFASAADGPIVARVDTSTGALTTTFDASAVGAPDSWAFAFWGGDFYIFAKEYDQASTTVYRVTASGQLSVYMPSIGMTIVGAGVSTCAPISPV